MPGYPKLGDSSLIHKPLRTGLILGCLLLLLAFIALVLTKPIGQDEGVFLTIGKYLNHGRLPYQDFFDHKPPALYFLFALLFKVFGTTVWVIKAALIISVLGTAVLLKKISDLLKPNSGWYAAGIFLFLMTQFEGNFLIAEPFMLLPLVLVLWLPLRFQRGPWLFVAGCSLGVALLFKQTMLLSAIPLAILSFRLGKRGRLMCLAGLILPWLIFAAYLSVNHIAAQAWHQVVTLTLTSYPAEPLGFVLHSLQTSFLWTLPIWGLCLLAWWPPFKHKRLIWSLVLVPLPFMFFRHYPHYWIQILPLIALLAAVVLSDMRVRAVSAATMLFCIAIAGGKVAQDIVPHQRQVHQQLAAVQVLAQLPVEAVLAENQFTGFYFLLPQPPLNRYLYITEITDAELAEQKTINNLQRSRSTLILWPQDPNFAYAKKLQAFIFARADLVRTFPALGMQAYILHDRPE